MRSHLTVVYCVAVYFRPDSMHYRGGGVLMAATRSGFCLLCLWEAKRRVFWQVTTIPKYWKKKKKSIDCFRLTVESLSRIHSWPSTSLELEFSPRRGKENLHLDFSFPSFASVIPSVSPILNKCPVDCSRATLVKCADELL